ncbi:MAG: metal-dependent transcriptional regulator [Firmicutes bacterium]|nr:metal-dependent transcriptional regulator [Bacillota bacterium]
MKSIQKSGEDYLEAVYNLYQKDPKVRSIDVAKALGVSKPSTFRALQNLAEQGYLNKENYGTPTLTPKGIEYAEAVLKKHGAIRMLLIDVLKVSPEVAEVDACKIEHEISEETTERLYEFLNIK